jgi:hypothetical protein
LRTDLERPGQELGLFGVDEIEPHLLLQLEDQATADGTDNVRRPALLARFNQVQILALPTTTTASEKKKTRWAF